MKKGVFVLALVMAMVMLLPSMASAQTLDFSMNAMSGNVTAEDIDIVKVGGYVDGDYQYLYVEFRGSGINTPPSDNTNVLSIEVDVNMNGEETDGYVAIILSWSNSNGEITPSYVLTTGGENSSSFSMLTDQDVTISGNTVTVRVPAALFQDIEVLKVVFTAAHGLFMSGDQVIYYTNAGGSSDEDTDTGDSGTGTYDESELGTMALVAGAASLACGIIWFVVWLLVALWAYKDAKKKCDDHPIIWFLVVFLLGLLGLIIYLVIRKDKCQQQTTMQAPPPPA